jgi:Spy/CpxP family protein refolding chaperone
MKKIIGVIKQDIQAVLTPEQQDKLKELKQEGREKFQRL